MPTVPSRADYGQLSRDSQSERLSELDESATLRDSEPDAWVAPMADTLRSTSRGEAPMHRPRLSDEAIGTRDVKIVVDWVSTPTLSLARAHQKLARPLYKLVDDEKVPLDPADARLTDRGFREVPDEVPHPSGDIGNNCKVSKYELKTTTISELGTIGGPGLRIYFNLLQMLSYTFLFMAVLMTPAGLAAGWEDPMDPKSASMYNHDEAAPYREGMVGIRWSLGNIRGTEAEADGGMIWQLWLYAWLDAACSFMLLCLILLMRKKQSNVEKDADIAMVSMSDYTVVVKPQDDKTWEQYPKARKDDFVADLKRYLEETICDENYKYVTVSEVVQDGTRIPSIWPGYDEELNIAMWRDKMKALFLLETAIGKAVKTKDASALVSGGEAVGVVRKLNKINSAIRQAHETVQLETVCAFVTFEHDDDYETTKEWAAHLDELLTDTPDMKAHPKPGEEDHDRKHSHFTFKPFEGHMLKVEPADEPEVIQWEHLEYTGNEKIGRKVLTIFLTLVTLCAGFALIIGAARKRDQFGFLVNCDVFTSTRYLSNSTGAYCDGLWNVGANTPLAPTAKNVAGATRFYYRAWKQMDTLRNEPWTPAVTDLIPTSLKYDSIVAPQPKLVTDRIYTETGLCIPGVTCCPARVTMWTDAVSRNCTRVDNRLQLEGAPAFRDGGSRDSFCHMCYCVKTHVPGTRDTPECAEFTAEEKASGVWALIATMVIVLTNQCVKILLEKVVTLEKEHTLSSENQSLAIKIFVAQLLNTAVLAVLVKTDLSVFSSIPGVKYTDVNATVIAKVVQPLILTMSIQFMTAPGVHFAKYNVQRLKRKVLWRSKPTQNALNALYEDNEMNVSSSYAEVLLGVFVTLVYATALPALLWVAAIGFFLKFWGDKWAVLRSYKKPPLFGSQLFNTVHELMFLALTLHVTFATYFLTMAGAAKPNDYLPRRMRPHAFPTAIMALVCLGVSGTVIVYRAIFVWSRYGRSKRIKVEHYFALHSNKCYRRCFKNMQVEVDHRLRALTVMTEGALAMTGDDLSGVFQDSGDQQENMEQVALHHAAGGKGEDLPTFSEALTSGMIVNGDDDYYMDELEELRELEQSMLAQIQACHKNDEFPFDDDDLAELVFEAAKNPVEDEHVGLMADQHSSIL